MYSLDASAGITSVLAPQSGIARVDQLVGTGVTREEIAVLCRARRWQMVGSVVVAAHNGPLTKHQQEWAVVLNAGPRAALCGRSAAAHCGLQNWDDGFIHVLVERGATPPPIHLPVKHHESRRYAPGIDLHLTKTPPMTRIDRSVVDGAAWTPQSRYACGLVVAAVQQRLTTAERLIAELDVVGRVRHRRLLKTVLADVAGGAHALSEVDFTRLCRRHGLPAPIHQAVREDDHGRRRYVDVEFRSRRGRTWLVEIDGAVHLIAGSYWRDMSRANEIVLGGDSLLRFPTVMLYLDESRVVQQLRRALED